MICWCCGATTQSITKPGQRPRTVQSYLKTTGDRRAIYLDESSWIRTIAILKHSPATLHAPTKWRNWARLIWAQMQHYTSDCADGNSLWQDVSFNFKWHFMHHDLMRHDKELTESLIYSSINFEHPYYKEKTVLQRPQQVLYFSCMSIFVLHFPW